MIDDDISTVGTANMDTRSFEQNFEINALLYNKKLTMNLAESFRQDISESLEINSDVWRQRPFFKKLLESIIRLFSPLL